VNNLANALLGTPVTPSEGSRQPITARECGSSWEHAQRLCNSPLGCKRILARRAALYRGPMLPMHEAPRIAVNVGKLLGCLGVQTDLSARLIDWSYGLLRQK
jgi:hypothetical protein